jgi:tetratricopeptide (TPR) repeat protein
MRNLQLVTFLTSLPLAFVAGGLLVGRSSVSSGWWKAALRSLIAIATGVCLLRVSREDYFDLGPKLRILVEVSSTALLMSPLLGILRRSEDPAVEVRDHIFRSILEVSGAAFLAWSIPVSFLPVERIRLQAELESRLSSDQVGPALETVDQLERIGRLDPDLETLRSRLLRQSEELIKTTENTSGQANPLERAEALARLGRWDDSLFALESVSADRPERWLLSGAVMMETRRYGEAIDAYHKAIQALKDGNYHTDVHRKGTRRCLVAMARCRARLGDYEGAIETRGLAAKSDPSLAWTDQFEIALFNYDRGDARTAIIQMEALKPLLPPVDRRRAEKLSRAWRSESRHCLIRAQ